MAVIVETTGNKVWQQGRWAKKAVPIEYLAGFFGECFGVVVLPKSFDSRTLKVMIVDELDGDWFERQGGPINSVWLPDLVYCLQSAKQWIDDHPVQ